MKTSSVLKLVGLALVVLLVVVAYRLLGTVIQPKVAHRIAEIGLSANEIAAKGPLPGDVSLYAKELACSQSLDTPGYFSTLNGAEISDAERSGRFPCATFTGSFDGPNQVYAWRSADTYPGISYINNGMPGELYIVGGEFPTLEDPQMVGPYIAKADAASGKEIWRTYVDNPNASGRWIGNANLNLLENGNIAFSRSNQIILLDTRTGAIMKHNTLPSGDTPAADVNFKHLTIAPDGTLILKDQTRPAGCTLQGTMAIIKCAAEGMAQQNSVLLAVNAETLEVIDMLQLPEPAPSPHIVTMFEGRIAIYIGLNQSLRRYFWDPASNKLSVDETWQIFPMQKGQTTATAPSVIGNWISVQLNGLFTDKRASSVVVVSQKDAANQHVIFPFGELDPGEWSFAPPKGTADPENSMIYSADMGMKQVAGIRLDQSTGELKLEFVIDAISNTFQPLIGPKEKRVLLLTNSKQNVAKEPVKAVVFTANYTEQLTWRDAATGRLLAESDFFEPLTINSLTPPGFGGRVYYPTAIGKSFMVLQVMPSRE